METIFDDRPGANDVWPVQIQGNYALLDSETSPSGMED
jgi:hypothetical protein